MVKLLREQTEIRWFLAWSCLQWCCTWQIFIRLRVILGSCLPGEKKTLFRTLWCWTLHSRSKWLLSLSSGHLITTRPQLKNLGKFFWRPLMFKGLTSKCCIHTTSTRNKLIHVINMPHQMYRRVFLKGRSCLPREPSSPSSCLSFYNISHKWRTNLLSDTGKQHFCSYPLVDIKSFYNSQLLFELAYIYVYVITRRKHW